MATEKQVHGKTGADFMVKVENYLEQVVQAYQAKKRWGCDTQTHNLRVESAVPGPPPKISFLFTVSENMCNSAGDLHGGCVATLIDNFTTVLLGVISRPGFYGQLGVSRSLEVTYFRPLRQGDEGRLICYVVNAGKTLAALRAELYDARSGSLCAAGENDKVNTDARISKI
ncbi:HotDog domain-containing protein [Aspergillus floccosus]